MKYFVLVLIAVLFSSFTFADTPYAESWFISGSTFNLDEATYELFLSNSNTQIMLINQNQQGQSKILNQGECMETAFRKVCFTERDNTVPRVRGVFYEKKTDISVLINVDSDQVFQGDEITWTIEINHNLDTNPKNFSFLGVFPSDITISDPTGCTIEEKIIRITREELTGKTECTFKSKSFQRISYELIAEYSYTIQSQKKTYYTSPKKIEFLPHYEFKANAPDVFLEQSFPMYVDMWRTIDNNLDVTLNIYVPPDISLMNPSAFNKITNNISAHRIYEKIVLLRSDPHDFFILEIFPHKPGSHIIIVETEYTLNNRKYRNTERIVFDIETPEDYVETTDPCPVKNLNITSTLNTTKEYYAGEELYFLIYLENEFQDRLENVSIEIRENNKLIGKKKIDTLYPRSRTIFTPVFSKIRAPITYKIDITYICRGDERREISDLEPNIQDFQNIIIIKNASKTEVYPGEIITVRVHAENSMKIPVSEISFFEEIPQGGIFQGTTINTIRIPAENEEHVYTYTFIAPRNPGAYNIPTNVAYKIGEQNIEFKEDYFIEVLDEEITLHYEIFMEEDKKYLFEPSELRFVFTNNRSLPFYNISFTIPPNSEFDVGRKDAFTFPVLFPNQKIEYAIPILPRKKNITTDEFLLEYVYDSRSVSQPIAIKTSLSPARTIFPDISYTAEITKNLDGTQNARIIITNPSQQNAEYYLSFEQTVRTIEPESTATLTYTNRRLENYNLVEYNLFGTRYIVAPQSLTITEEQRPVISENTEEVTIVGEIESEEEIEEEIMEIIIEENSANYIYIFAIILTVVIGLTGILIVRKIKNQIKIKEINVKDIKLSPKSVVSYDEYEFLKKDLESKTKK